jgi:hypothetical protein
MKEFCEYCGGKDTTEHHLIRRSAGGTDNGTVYLCFNCHEDATNNKKFENALQLIFADRIGEQMAIEVDEKDTTKTKDIVDGIRDKVLAEIKEFNVMGNDVNFLTPKLTEDYSGILVAHNYYLYETINKIEEVYPFLWSYLRKSSKSDKMADIEFDKTIIGGQLITLKNETKMIDKVVAYLSRRLQRLRDEQFNKS